MPWGYVSPQRFGEVGGLVLHESCAQGFPSPEGNLSAKNLKILVFLLGLRCSCAATWTIGPTISSSPMRGNLPSLRGSLSDGMRVMILLFESSPSVLCFKVANASLPLSTVLVMVISLCFLQVASTDAHFSSVSL